MKQFKILVMFVLFLTSISIINASGEECECKQTGKNIFLGHGAGKSNTGPTNTFLGYTAGYSNTTGGGNTFSGCVAGYANTTGSLNTFSGFGAGERNTTGVSNTFSGYGTGTFNTTGNYNTYFGYKAGCYNKTGNNNSFLGFETGFRNTAGSGNVYIGYRAGYNETGSNKLYIANDSNNILIYGDFMSKKVGIGTTAPSYNLDVNGTIRASGNVIASCGTLTCSDLRYKEDVRPIENALDKITNLQGVSFRWKDKEDDEQQLGVIGQEVEKVFPEVVSTDNQGYKSVGYSNLVAPLIEAVKELKRENDKLKSRIQTLEKKMKN